MDKEWLWAMVILPVIIGFFKTEISNLLTAWNVYRLRAFDMDGNPETSDVVEMLNGAKGEWEPAIIKKYKFWAGSKKRGVYIEYPDGGEEKISFLTWASIRKRKPPKITAEQLWESLR